MKKSLIFSLGVAAALAVAQPSYAAGPIGFAEFMGPSLIHITDEVDSVDRGVAGTGIFRVDKFTHNISGVSWHNFRIQLQRQDASGNWVNSDPGDGVSFGDIEDNATFVANTVVNINSVDQDLWNVVRNVLTDTLSFSFGFAVLPGDTLSLHFDMSDNDSNIWRLVQTVPEPTSLALLGTGLAGLALAWRRKRKQA